MSCVPGNHNYSLPIYKYTIVSSYQPMRKDVVEYACSNCGDTIPAQKTDEESKRG